ncbi:uncharacterized protein LOC127455605 [Myxocyprinus asiaticus]|uniref:uncharacterized protein LOC127455605 n=1 Tax=Myxocyprinus asiaticus TaxID=70543 RepID=UPI0022239CF7|nr:uncharacterized protein LOC127455605 [Myxocyprinus asiaticus]
MRSNSQLRGWRHPCQSSSNIREAVNNEYSWQLQQNTMTPWRSLRTRWDDSACTARGRRTSPSLSAFSLFDEPCRSENPGLFLSRTRSVPETLHCLNSPSLRSSFSLITITAQSLSSKRNKTDYPSSSINPLDMLDKLHFTPSSVMTYNEDKTLQAKSGGTLIPLRCKPVVVTVTECTQWCCRSEMPSSTQALSDGEAVCKTDSSTSSKRHVFRSCAHLEVLPCQLSRSTLYLDKSLSIPLEQSQEDSGTLHRSTLSLSLGRTFFKQTSEKPGTVTYFKRSYSDWDIAHSGVDGMERPSWHLTDTPTINGSAFRNNTSSGSNMHYSTSTSLPFRTRCHSSSAAFRLNGKANDVLGPPQSNLRARQAFSKRSEPILNKMVDSSVIISVKHHRQDQHATTESDLKDSEANSYRSIGVPQVRARAPHEVRTISNTAEKFMRVTECPVSPHMDNCTCGSRADQHDTKPQSLSLREALELFRPDFIYRSQNRVWQLEQRARQRRSLQTVAFIMGMETANHQQNCTKPHPLSDNLFKPRDRAISGKEMKQRSRRIYNKLPEVTRKKEEERRRLVSHTNRLRAEVFKKKLLDQILQRHSD